jgi:hypothetical protein
MSGINYETRITQERPAIRAAIDDMMARCRRD